MWSAPLGGRPLPGGLRADGLGVRPDVPPGGDGHPAPGDREFSPLGVGGVGVYRVGQTVERRLGMDMLTVAQLLWSCAQDKYPEIGGAVLQGIGGGTGLFRVLGST